MRAVWAFVLTLATLLAARPYGAQSYCNNLVASGIFLNPPFTTSTFTRQNVHAALCAVPEGYSISAYQGATGSTASYFNILLSVFQSTVSPGTRRSITAHVRCVPGDDATPHARRVH